MTKFVKKVLTYLIKYDIIIIEIRKGGKKMIDYIIIATALINLLTAIINIVATFKKGK